MIVRYKQNMLNNELTNKNSTYFIDSTLFLFNLNKYI